MKITVFGTRGSYPVCRPSVMRYGGNTTCLYLESGKDRIVIDGGSGVAPKARFIFHQIGSDGVEIRDAKVDCQSAHHSELCFATRIRFLDQTFCYVTDHEARPGSANDGIVKFMQGADAVLHDAQYTADEYRARAGWGHSSIEAALENAQRADVRHLFLTHHDPLHSDAFLHDYAAKLELPNGLRVSLAAEGRVDEP